MGAAASTTSSTSTSSTTVADTAPAATSTSSTGSDTSAVTPPTMPVPPTTPVPPPAPSTSTNVTLAWVAPTENNDGSPITNLAGYKIHYGTTSSEYTETVALHNAGLTRYVLDSLKSGTYYFAITAYNVQGIESPLSGEITTTVD